MSKGNSTFRTRNYATIVYLDSAPEDWRTILAESKTPIFISPYHDKDVNADGTPKKPHFHVMVMFDNVKTTDQAEEFFKSFGGVGVEIIKSRRAYARYLCHLDNPEKFRYEIDDVRAYGGADYIHEIGTCSDKLQSIREMRQYVNEFDIICYADLFDFAADNRSDWFDCLCNSGAYTMKEYIKSRTWKLHKLEEK